MESHMWNPWESHVESPIRIPGFPFPKIIYDRIVCVFYWFFIRINLNAFFEGVEILGEVFGNLVF